MNKTQTNKVNQTGQKDVESKNCIHSKFRQGALKGMLQEVKDKSSLNNVKRNQQELVSFNKKG